MKKFLWPLGGSSSLWNDTPDKDEHIPQSLMEYNREEKQILQQFLG